MKAIDTKAAGARLLAWCLKEALAADQLALESERTAKAWREAAAGLRQAAKELETP
jgi:hypothetical protein